MLPYYYFFFPFDHLKNIKLLLTLKSKFSSDCPNAHGFRPHSAYRLQGTGACAVRMSPPPKHGCVWAFKFSVIIR